MAPVLEVTDLVKCYGDLRAVDGVTFTVDEGEIFGMVGPNGAGKTTTIECLEGLRQPDGGRVSVYGKDPYEERRTVMERIGIQLQESDLPSRLRVREALNLFASFYAESIDPEMLLERMGLQEKAKSPVTKLSGGQKQRLFIALALINRPEVVFLDELTTGLDPQARRSMWDLVREIRDQGSTVFLTTHYMEEAERLCDRVAIMDYGKIVALDSPRAMIRDLGIERRLSFYPLNGSKDLGLEALPGVELVERRQDRVIVSGSGKRFISRVVNALEDSGIDFDDLRTEQPNLEDVFLSLTGRAVRE
ncbi:MAG: ABC transporter ATP-binding protein [Anaerolineales bacterium]|nr:MAG: ABC transporter ATP-binding protein [Anaerolineales bacterium]